MHMLIDGKEVAAANETWMDVINPATSEVLGHVPAGTKTDVDAAVESAEAAFGTWSKKTTRERGLILYHAAELVRQNHQALGRQLTLEQGKPIREAIDEVRGCANILEYYASIAGKPAGEAIQLGNAGDCMVTREPLGVCGAIIPWNMPVLIMGWKVGPALLAGNTLVLKPASRTPLTTLKIAAILRDAGVPPGVLNVVTGAGETVGAALVKHPSVQKISFTGDCATGHQIREMTAHQNKEITLELGGSDPMIVMADADIDRAVEGAIRGRFYNAGQVCTAVKRLYLHEKIAPAFTKKLKARTEALHVGDGLLPATDIGPMTGKDQLARIAAQVEEAREREEGTILCGGCTLPGKEYERGFFYQPTLVADVAPGTSLVTNEIFGPVLPVMTFPDLDAAIGDANRTRYGLGASVWTKDIGTVKRVYREVRAGIIWVNRHLALPPEIPFGGVNESGIGRENGYNALESYSRTKTLYLGW
ncbi:MAG: aldehyde dehydrogenase family protein [Methanoregula sp.]|nr:aldehyde dehydrogenase family protein [Methanoregula sp.]